MSSSKARSSDGLATGKVAFLDTFGFLLLSDAAEAQNYGIEGTARACALLRKAEETFQRAIDLAHFAIERTVDPNQVDFSDNSTLLDYPTEHIRFTREALNSC